MCYTLPTNNSYYTILVLHENKLNSSPEPSRGATRNKAWKETHHNKPMSSCCIHVFDLAPTQTSRYNGSRELYDAVVSNKQVRQI